jgi:hypothetical protein
METGYNRRSYVRPDGYDRGMATMTYLILHKVRGEPAFDIAEKLQIGDEEGWIIPTSGHRAYPYKTWDLERMGYNLERPPDDWPDHYQVQGSAPPPTFNIMEAISGLLPKIRRRV